MVMSDSRTANLTAGSGAISMGTNPPTDRTLCLVVVLPPLCLMCCALCPTAVLNLGDVTLDHAITVRGLKRVQLKKPTYLSGRNPQFAKMAGMSCYYDDKQY